MILTQHKHQQQHTYIITIISIMILIVMITVAVIIITKLYLLLCCHHPQCCCFNDGSEWSPHMLEFGELQRISSRLPFHCHCCNMTHIKNGKKNYNREFAGRTEHVSKTISITQTIATDSSLMYLMKCLDLIIHHKPYFNKFACVCFVGF